MFFGLVESNRRSTTSHKSFQIPQCLSRGFAYSREGGEGRRENGGAEQRTVLQVRDVCTRGHTASRPKTRWRVHPLRPSVRWWFRLQTLQSKNREDRVTTSNTEYGAGWRCLVGEDPTQIPPALQAGVRRPRGLIGYFFPAWRGCWYFFCLSILFFRAA